MLTGMKVSGNRSTEPKTKARSHLLDCGMQLICVDDNE